MLSPVARLLAVELEAAGFKPDSLCAKMVGARIAFRGEEEYRNLPESITAAGAFRRTSEHHLGIGASLTDFLVSGLGLGVEQRAEVATLGGIAHLIYAVFDELLDHDGCVPDLFSKSPVASLAAGLGSKHQFVNQLVETYFERLGPVADGTGHVRSLLEKAIRRLHQAELESAASPASVRQVWWRKNALPIAVMGMPAWLHRISERYISFTEHVQWLVRVGEFFGWLDDFSDYERDQASGHLNRLRLERTTSIEALAQRVGDKGRRVLFLWDSQNRDSPARDTFRVLVWTWLTNQEM